MLSMVSALFSDGRGRLNRPFFAIIAIIRFVRMKVILLHLGKWLKALCGVGKLSFSLCHLDGLMGSFLCFILSLTSSTPQCVRTTIGFHSTSKKATPAILLSRDPQREYHLPSRWDNLSQTLTLQSYEFLFARKVGAKSVFTSFSIFFLANHVPSSKY